MKSKDVADKILKRIRKERYLLQPAIGRVDVMLDEGATTETFWIIRTKRGSSTEYKRDIHNNIVDMESGDEPYLDEDVVVSRDSKFGGSLIAAPIGKTRLLSQGNTLMDANVLTLAKYNPITVHGDASQGVISTDEDTIRFANSLLEELKKLSELEQQVEQIEADIEDRRKTEEERVHLRDKLQRKQAELRKQQEKVTKFRIRSNQLRGQAILDPEQELIKRSRIFNGGLIIDGGPGTGKTTSLIQRITFLTSPTIVEYTPELSDADKKLLSGKETGWIFFSPSELLRQYLRNAMDQEGLSADQSKVLVWGRYRSVLFRECGFVNPATRRPFLVSRQQHQIFHLTGSNISFIIDAFEKFHFQRQTLKIDRMSKLEIDGFSWGQLGIAMRKVVQGYAAFNSYAQWINLYVKLRFDFHERASEIGQRLRKEIQELSETLHVQIKQRGDLAGVLDKELQSRFEKKIAPESEEEERVIDEFEEEGETTESGMMYDFDVQLGKLLRRIVRLASLSELDRNTKLSRKEKNDYDLIEFLLDRTRLRTIGEDALFVKYFHKLARGVESNLLLEIPTSYKTFRRTVLLNSTWVTNEGRELLRGFVTDGNRKISEDEMDLLLFASCRTARSLYTANPTLYENSTNPILSSFRLHAKAVVAIDEATDFSALQLACMASLSHPRFNSFTLSGDLMQRLSPTGLRSWDDFIHLFPSTEVRQVRISYRQTRTLLEIAHAIYRNQLGVEPGFDSDSVDHEDPLPLVFKAENIDKKIEWIADRIVEIHKIYGETIPSIALFFKDDITMLEFAKELKQSESLRELDIHISPCANGDVLGDADTVRLFAAQYIKGMEFEVVFFIDIDLIANEHPELVDKYVYVGLSRANLYLAVTLHHEFPQSLNYLEPLFQHNGSWLV